MPELQRAMHSTPAVIREILTTTRTWVLVGCSPRPARDSPRIARLLQEHGYRVIPVNPGVEEILGERCYASVLEIPASEGVEVVDIFRRPDLAGVHVQEAITIGARAVWLQLGVIDEAAARRALEAGLLVVMGPLSGDRAAAARVVQPRICVSRISPATPSGRVSASQRYSSARRRSARAAKAPMPSHSAAVA